MGDLSSYIRFSINHHPKNKNTAFNFQTNTGEEIFNNFEIINYLNSLLLWLYLLV